MYSFIVPFCTITKTIGMKNFGKFGPMCVTAHLSEGAFSAVLILQKGATEFIYLFSSLLISLTFSNIGYMMSFHADCVRALKCSGQKLVLHQTDMFRNLCTTSGL